MGSSSFTVVTGGVDKVRVLWNFPDDDPPQTSTFVYDGNPIMVFSTFDDKSRSRTCSMK